MSIPLLASGPCAIEARYNVRLRRHGDTLEAICPLHEPSLHVLVFPLVKVCRAQVLVWLLPYHQVYTIVTLGLHTAVLRTTIASLARGKSLFCVARI